VKCEAGEASHQKDEPGSDQKMRQFHNAPSDLRQRQQSQRAINQHFHLTVGRLLKFTEVLTVKRSVDRISGIYLHW
jgi:hypothetical protein